MKDQHSTEHTPRRRGIGSILLAFACAAALAGCSGGGNDDDDDDDDTAPGTDEQVGYLNVTVAPSDATVEVVGPAGAIPAFTGNQLITDLEPGRYTARATRSGYAEAAGEINVVAGQTSIMALILSQSVSSLNINVTPADAAVVVTGPGGFTRSFTGNELITDLDPGRYTATATRNGYLGESSEISVVAGQTSLLALILQSEAEVLLQASSLNVNVSPPDATVVVTGPDGFTRTFTGNQMLADLDPGQYGARATRDGYVTKSATINVVEGLTSSILLLLDPTPLITTSVRAVYRDDNGNLVPIDPDNLHSGQFVFYAWLLDLPSGVLAESMNISLDGDPGKPLLAEQIETAPSFTQNLATAWVGFMDSSGVVRPVIGADVRWEIDQWWTGRINSTQFGTSDDNRIGLGYGVFDDQADTRTNNAGLEAERFPLLASEYPLFNGTGIGTPFVDGLTWVTLFSPDREASSRIVAVASIDGEEIGKQILYKNFAPSPELEITKSVSPGLVSLVNGTASVTWTITVRNVGTGDATGVDLSDFLISGNGVTYTLSALPPGSIVVGDGFTLSFPLLAEFPEIFNVAAFAPGRSESLLTAASPSDFSLVSALEIPPFPAPPPLGNVESFAVLGNSAVTNSGSSIVTGDVGVSAGSSVTGFPPGVVLGGTIHNNDAIAIAAQVALTTAYNDLTSRACTAPLNTALSGATLAPGVYCYDSSVGLTGPLVLDALGDPAAEWIFKITSTLITAAGASVSVINQGSPCNVSWQVGSSVTLGASNFFIGNLFAQTSITVGASTSITGRALARIGAVTLDSNAITPPAACAPAIGCGNGVVDPGEACDAGAGNTLGGCGCQVGTCQWGPGCDNGLTCDGAEICDAGHVCQTGVPVNCDDAVPCTLDGCAEPGGTCTHAPNNAMCNDGLFCTGLETCNVTAGCQSGGNPCVPAASCDEVLNICVGVICGNGIVELGEACDAGAGNVVGGCGCQVGICQWGLGCDNGLACDGAEICDAAHVCQTGVPVNCDDTIPCTLDWCAEPGGTCSHAPINATCNDGLFCNGLETCNVTAGCQSRGNACVPPSSCDEALNACVGVICGNGIVEPGEACDAGAGNVLGGCGCQVGICQWGPGCDNGLACDGAEICDAAHVCQTGVPVNCDDTIPCTLDGCTEPGGGCSHAPNNAMCNDGQFCTGLETCNVTAGCQSGGNPCVPPSSCDEALNACVGVICGNGIVELGEVCDAGAGNVLGGCGCQVGLCEWGPGCSDGLVCNGVELCNASHICISGTAVNCDDSVICTLDSCTEPAGICAHAPNNASCNDGLFCDGLETCNAALGCQSSGNPCVPASSCNETANVCTLAGQGYTFTFTGTVTAPGIYCNMVEILSYQSATNSWFPVDLNAEACFTVLESNLSLVKDFVAEDNTTSLGQSVTVAANVPATLRVRVVNSGTGAATGVEVSDLLTSGAPGPYQLISVSQGTPNGSDGFDTTVGGLAAGASVTLLFDVSASADGEYCDTATVTATSGSIGNGSDTACLTVATPELEISKVDAPSSVLPGGSYTSTIIVTNTGSATARNVVISDLLGLNAAVGVRAVYVSSSLDGVGGTLTGSAVATPVPFSIPAGGSVTFTVVSRIPLGAVSGEYCDTATVTSSDTPSKEASDCVDVPAFSALQTQLIDLNDPVAVGSQVTFFSVLYVEALSNEGVGQNKLTFSFGLTSPNTLGIPGVFDETSTNIYLDTSPVRDPTTGLVVSDTSNATASLLTLGADYTLADQLGKQVVTMTPGVILEPDTALYVVHVVVVPAGTPTNRLYTTSYIWDSVGLVNPSNTYEASSSEPTTVMP